MNTKRLEETKKNYSAALDKLQTDEEYFTEYLKYSGRFYKVPTTHAIALFECSPNATMLADYDTWKKYGNYVKQRERSSAALIENGTKLKHYFDISQTTAVNIPFQWSIDKDIAEEFLKDEAKINGRSYRNMASYINNAAVNQINGIAEEILSKFDIAEKDKKAFLYSAATMVMTTAAARCEHKSGYRYKTPGIPDLAALHMLKTKEDVVKLCDLVHSSAHSILSKMEKSITQIINIRTEELKNGRNRNDEVNRGVEQQVSRQQGGTSRAASRGREAGADLVRGNERVVSDVHSGGKGHGDDSVQAERGRELHLQSGVLGREVGGNGDDRVLRQEMAGVYGAELPRHGADNEYQQLGLGDSVTGGGQGSGGTVQPTGRTVSESKSPSHNVYGDSQVGENEAVGDRSRGDGDGGASISGQSERDGINKKAAEASKEASAVFNSDSLSAGDVIKIIDDKENFEKYGVVESVYGDEIKLDLYSLEDTAFCSKSGVITHDIKTFGEDYRVEYTGRVNELRRDDYEENKEIYAAFVNRDIVYLNTVSAEQTEAYPLQNAHSVKFKNLRIEYNETDGEDYDKGFVLKGDSDKAKDLILVSYGEISPENMNLWLKHNNYTVERIERAKIEKSFSEQVDDALNGQIGAYENLKVCDTPQILIDAGCRQLPMLYTQQHLRDAIKPKSDTNSHLHGLTIEQIKEIPYLLENPAILFDSISPVKNGNNSIIAVLNKTDNDKAPIVVSIKPNGTGVYQLERVESNFITSIYGKDKGFKNYIERAAKSGNVLFWDKKMSQELFMFQGLQLPEALNNLDSNVIIHQSRNIVNPQTQEISENQRDTNNQNFPTITCELSESPVFEEGKVYSVYDFDRLMLQADDERCFGKKAAIEEYGSEEAWYDSDIVDDFTEYKGYDKVRFTINMPNGERYTERQDIGDGYGGVIGFLSHYPQYDEIIPILKEAQYTVRQQEIAEFKKSVENQTKEAVQNNHAAYITINAVRIGDFYEIFGDEAKIAAEKLGLALTSRNGEPMVGFPQHALEQYKNKLEATGYNLKLFEDLREYRTEKIVSEKAEKYILPKLAFDEQVAITDEFFNYENAWHNVSKEIAEAAERYRKGEDVKEDLAKIFFKNDVNLSEWETIDKDIYKIEIFTDEKGIDVCCENAKRHFSWEDAAALHWNYLKDTFKEIQFERVSEYPEIKEDVDRLIANISNNEQTQHIDLKADDSELHNFIITDPNLGLGGLKTKCAANIAAIKTLKQIEAENRNATPEEQEILSRYVGWGGMAQEVFKGNNEKWAKEHTQLKELLTDEEYAAAQSSALNAHYTTPTVINAIYKALDNMGFKKGNVLEPSMGIGNFFGCMPEKMKGSKLYGVEIDSITGRIAKQLYPKADIQIKGFEKTNFPDNFFDVAIGNVPFGSYGVADRQYDKHNFLIHDYFFAKTLDKVAEGGVIAFVTSKGTLDKANPKVREYIAQRADLLGAIRLPGGKDGAFKGNAGTEVTSDIIFFQKRKNAPVKMPDWVYLGETADGIPVNQYFADNPEMMLGKMEYSTKMYGGKNTTCTPFEGEELSEQLDRAVSRLKTNIAIKTRTEKQEKAQGTIPATEDVRNFTHTIIDGKVYFRENDIMREKFIKGEPVTGKHFERIKRLIELRERLRGLITAQSENCADEKLKELQEKLSDLYDKFIKDYGYINDKGNRDVFRDDDDYNTLCALEIINPETHVTTKSEIFTKRTIKANTEITHVDNPQEALQVSLDMKGRVDIPYMAQLCGSSHEQVIDRLVSEGIIYLNPEKYEEQGIGAYEEASEYLSGNVRQKLRIAELAAETKPDLFTKNVEALKKAIPPTIEAGEIKVRLGVSWVEPKDYQQFLCEYAKAAFSEKEPLWRTFTGEYKVPGNRDYSIAATSTYGTSRISSYKIMEQLLNNRDIIIRDAVLDQDGNKHYVINDKETQLAKDKARQMQSAFQRWLWENPERRQKYVIKYNELFNSIVGRHYDGSHQSFPGMSPYIELKPHQKDAVARTKFGGNTLLAHCVGAGKSFEMAAAIMEKKRLGLINKACMVVPKHLVGQTANEWLRLYPQAKLLVATEKDFDKNNRQKFIARCCTGDYAAVVMSYEQFEKIPMSFEYRKKFMDKEMDILKTAIAAADKNDRGTIKDLERTKKNLEKRIERLLDGGKTKDRSLSFEELGFDCLVVDEAHNYKNGLVVTKMSRVAGVQTTPAQKSEDILMKTHYLNETYGCKNIIFATGTPVTNSMTELYTMQRYLRPDLLQNAGLQNFDDWASNFGEVVTQLELKPAGDGYRPKKRFSKFVNLPELMQMYKEFADIRTSDMLNLPVPEIEGGKPQTVVSKPNDFQKAALQILAERSERIHSGKIDPRDDNMLKITNEARLLGLDSRAVNPAAENYPDSKVNMCIDNIIKIYEETKEQKGVQAIFCDIAVNSDDGRFSVYDYLQEELERRGIPKSEICAAGDAKNQAQRSEMYAQLRSGSKRIVIASTTKMGTGANVQTRLAAMHHLDIPWKPSDLEQRNGRIIRQGNTFDKVKIFNYVTEDTFDSYMLNIIINKQKFISQLMSGKTPARTCEDVDEMVLNYSEMQALATGDPRIKEKIELDGEVARLRTLESEHYNNKYRLEDFIVNGEKNKIRYENQLRVCKLDKEFADKNKLPPDTFSVELGGKIYTERKEAAPILQKYILNTMVSGEPQKIGKFCGFDITVKREKTGFDLSVPVLFLQQGKNIQHSAELSLDSDMGNVTRMENILKLGIDKMISETESRLKELNEDLQEAKQTKDTPFEFAAELEEKAARLEQLNSELNKPDDITILDENEEQNDPDLDLEENENLDKPKQKIRR